MSRVLNRHRTPDSNGRGPAAAAMTSPHHICCGRQLQRIDIQSRESELSFTYCGRCESMRWFKNGWPTDDASLLGALRETTVQPRAARG